MSVFGMKGGCEGVRNFSWFSCEKDAGSRIQDTECGRAMSYNHCLRTFDKRKKRDNFNKTK